MVRIIPGDLNRIAAVDTHADELLLACDYGNVDELFAVGRKGEVGILRMGELSGEADGPGLREERGTGEKHGEDEERGEAIAGDW